jgi:hypothetical protein
MFTLRIWEGLRLLLAVAWVLKYSLLAYNYVSYGAFIA